MRGAKSLIGRMKSLIVVIGVNFFGTTRENPQIIEQPETFYGIRGNTR